jgi:uncharacterized membrane protein YfcA
LVLKVKKKISRRDFDATKTSNLRGVAKMFLLEFLYGLGIGIALGLTGAGGSIITVPVLVYLIGMNVHDATGASLVIVGASSVVGVLGYTKEKLVHWRIALVFATSGIASAFIGSYVNVLVPSKIILYFFAVTMILIGFLMLKRSKTSETGNTKIPSLKNEIRKWYYLIGAGLVIGFLTGFFGVGGGFLIVPALVIALKFPTKHAIATSLMIIALNSLWGIAARFLGIGTISTGPIIWILVGTIAGMLIGSLIAVKVKSEMLTKGFSYFIIIVAVYIFLRTSSAL